jgi:hypothetical protein
LKRPVRQVEIEKVAIEKIENKKEAAPNERKAHNP